MFGKQKQRLTHLDDKIYRLQHENFMVQSTAIKLAQDLKQHQAFIKSLVVYLGLESVKVPAESESYNFTKKVKKS